PRSRRRRREVLRAPVPFPRWQGAPERGGEEGIRGVEGSCPDDLGNPPHRRILRVRLRPRSSTLGSLPRGVSMVGFLVALIAAVLAAVFWFQAQSASSAVKGLKAESDAARKEAEELRAQLRDALAESKGRSQQILDLRD